VLVSEPGHARAEVVTDWMELPLYSSPELAKLMCSAVCGVAGFRW